MSTIQSKHMQKALDQSSPTHSALKHHIQQIITPSHSLLFQAPIPKSVLISIPISKSSVSRFRNSVEGLNQEIERIIIRDTGDREEQLIVSMQKHSLLHNLVSSENPQRHCVCI